QAHVAQMSGESRKQVLYVGPSPIPRREPMHSEGVTEIVQPGLITSIAAIHADMIPQPEERIFQNEARHGSAALIAEKRRCIGSIMFHLPAVAVVFGKH